MANQGTTCLRFLFLLGSALFFVTNACQTCNSRWKKIYENDASGERVSGNISDLIRAQKRGARTRYMVPSLGEAGYFEELDFSVIFSDTVCGESVTHVTKDRWDHFLDDGNWRFVVICTDGFYDTYEYNVGSPTFINETSLSVGAVWFVQESACDNPIYTHTKNGTAITGSIDALKQAVVLGYDIKYFIDLSFLFPFHNVEISESDEMVFGQNIWSINTPENGGAQWWFQMPSTTGFIDIQVWNVGEHVSQHHQAYLEPLEWLVEPCWRLAYAHDEYGNQMDGSLANLVAAVEKGHRVKVVIGTYSSEVDSVRTKWNRVSAQLLSQVSKNDSYNFLNETYTFLNDSFWVWQMVHTSGSVITTTYGIGNDTKVDEYLQEKTIKWFVDTRRWKRVLSTNRRGVTFGSKAALRTAIANGATVRVGLRFREVNRIKADDQSGRDSEDRDGHRDKDGHRDRDDHRDKDGHRNRHDHRERSVEKYDDFETSDEDTHGLTDHEMEELTDKNVRGGRQYKGWFVMKAENIEFGPNEEVAAELIKFVSTEVLWPKEFRIKDNPYWQFMIVTTEGTVDVSQWRIGAHINDGHFVRNAKVNWYVNL